MKADARFFVVDSAGLAMFVEVEIIGAAGGAILILFSSPGKRRCSYAVA